MENQSKSARFWQLLKKSLAGGEQDFTSGSITTAIVLLAIPMVLEMAMESVFAVVDIFFVAKIGPEAVATVGLTESVLTIVYSLAWGLAGAATAVVARRIGEKDREKASEAGAQAILLGLGFALVFGVVGWNFAPSLLRYMGASDWVATEGAGFTRLIFGSNVVIMLLFLNNGILRGAGDASTALRVLVVANLINIALDPLLIFGIGDWPGFGVTGAAMATTTGRGIGVLMQFYVFFKGNIVKLRTAHFRPVVSVLKTLVDVGSGTAGQFLIASGSWAFLMGLMASFGSEAVAGYTIAIRVLIFSLLPSWGLANAAATLVGQNLGAKQPERAEASVWRAGRWNMFFLGGVAVLSIFFAETFIRFFTDSPVAVEQGALALRVLCSGYVFYGWGMVVAQAFNGAGDSRTPTVINFVCFWLMQIPLAWLMVKKMAVGPVAISLAVVISESILALICILVFRRGRWKEVKV